MKKKRLFWLLCCVLLIIVVVAVVGVVVLMYWYIPTRVEVNLTVNRAEFTVSGNDSTAILNAPVCFQSITVEKFTSIKFRPEILEVADPGKYIYTTDRYPEDAWISLTVTSPVVITGEDETLQPAVTLESPEPGSTDSGTLDLVTVRPDAQVILELRGDRVEDLTIQVERQESFVTLSMPDSFQLISDYSQISGVTGFPYQEEASLTYRTQLPDDEPLIDVNSQSDSLVLLLIASSEKIEDFFFEGSIPVTSLKFERQGLQGKAKTTLIKGVEGHVSYPDYPKIEKVSFKSPDSLSLGKLKKFSIKEITLSQKDKGLQFRLSGIAGHIEIDSQEFSKDCRLTCYAILEQNPKLKVLYGVVSLVIGTLLNLGLMGLLKEFFKKPSQGSNPSIEETDAADTTEVIRKLPSNLSNSSEDSNNEG